MRNFFRYLFGATAQINMHGQPRNDRQIRQIENLIGKSEALVGRMRSDVETSYIANVAGFQELEKLQRQLRKQLKGRKK